MKSGSLVRFLSMMAVAALSMLGAASAADGQPAKNTSVILLWLDGGPSHLETFDPKPTLQRLHGQKLPDSFGAVKTRRGVDRCRWRFGRCWSLRRSGAWSRSVSRWP